MANTSYQISIGADFKELDGAFNSINKAIGQVSKTAAQFESAFKGALQGVENQTSRLQNAVRSVLRETSKLASSASPLGGAELAFKTGKFRSQLSNYGLPQDRIDSLIAKYEEANGAAIANLSKQITEARQESFAKLLQDNLTETKKQAEYAKQILHEGRLDNVIHRDTRDVYAKLQSLAKSAGVGDIGGQLEQLRIHTAQVIQREIENLEHDALAVGRAIKAADITRVESRIGSYREVLGTGEVARLNTLLQTTVASVTDTLQIQSSEALSAAIEAAINNVTLSSKQLKAQLESFRVDATRLGFTDSEFANAADVKQLMTRIQEVERQELLQFQKDTRKRITDNLREILQKTSVDLQQIYKLSADFKQAGGTSGDFAAKGTQGILSELVKRVADMKLKGQEFTRELERYYENLFRAVGVQGTQLASLVGFVKANASAVNSNAATMRMNAMRSEIAKIFVSYNRVNEAISKAIMDRMRRDWASVSSTDFNTEFASGLRGQETIVKRGEIKQAMEGIWKPFQKQLADLTELKAFLRRNNASSLEAYTSQIGPTLLRNLERQFASVKAALVEQSSGRHASISSAEANSIRVQLEGMLDEVGTDVDRKVAIELSRRMSRIRAQLRQVQAGNAAAMPDIKGVNATLAQAAKEASVKNDAQLQLRLNNTRKLLDDVTQQLAKDDALKRAQALIRSQTRSLGGEAALRAQLVEIRKAAAENAKAIKQYDREMAAALLRNARMMREQARQAAGVGRTSSKGDDPYGMHPGMLRNYRRQIPMQITDIVVGLSTGQLPMYVLLQQGGQLRDMFGGIGNAVKEVGKYLLGWTDNMTKFQMATAAAKRVLAGIAVGAIAGMALLMKKAADFNAQIKSTTVELRFRGSDVSGDEFRAYSEQMSRSLGIARTNAAEIFKQIALDAKLPKESFDSLIEGLDDISTALGKGWDTKGLQETVTLLGQSFKDKDSFKQLAADYALFTDEQYKAILQLYDQKDAAGAASLAMETLKKNTLGAKDEAMTPFQKAVDEAKKELLNCLQVVGDGSAWQALLNNLTEAAKGFINLIGPIAKAASAVMSFIKIIGNTAVGAVFKGEALLQGATVSGQGARIERLTGQLKALKEAESISGANTLRSARMNDIQQQIKEAELARDYAKVRQEAAEMTSSFSKLDASDAIDELTGLKKAAQDALAPTAKLTATTASLAGALKRHSNGEDKDKPNKRGGGSRGAQTDKDLENAQRYVQQLKEQYDQVSKMTVSQKLEYDIQEGKVKLQGELLDKARYYAQILDDRALKEAEATRQMQLQVLQEEKRIALENRYREMQYEVAKLMGSDRSADYFKGLIDFDIELERNAKKIRRERDKAIRDAEIALKPQAYIDGLKKYYDDWLDEERKFTADSIELYKQRQKEIDELSRQWTVGYKDGLEEVADWLFSISSEVSSAVQNWAGGLADALATAARTGKLSFKDLANSILDDIARIASRQFVSALFGGFQYGWTATPQSSQSKTAESLMSKSVPQNVFVVNKGFGSFTKAAESLGGITEAVKGGFTLGGGSNTDLGPDPWGLAGTSDKVVQRIGSEVSPAIREGANSMFSGLFDKIGSIFSGIGSSISNLFNGIKLPSFSFGGGGGGFFSSLFSGIGNFFSSLFGLFASGGYTGSGGKYTPAGIVHKGEFVINAASTRKLGLDFLNRLNGYADGGYVTPTPSIVHSNMSKDMNNGLEVNIYNQTDSKITAQRNSSGGLDIFVEQAVNAVAGNIAAGGAVASAIQRAYALNRGVGTQRTGY